MRDPAAWTMVATHLQGWLRQAVARTDVVIVTTRPWEWKKLFRQPRPIASSPGFYVRWRTATHSPSPPTDVRSPASCQRRRRAARRPSGVSWNICVSDLAWRSDHSSARNYTTAGCAGHQHRGLCSGTARRRKIEDTAGHRDHRCGPGVFVCFARSGSGRVMQCPDAKGPTQRKQPRRSQGAGRTCSP